MQEFKVGDKVLVEMEIICEGLGRYNLSCDGCPDSLDVNKENLGKVATKKTYDDGMAEAWSIARKIAVAEEYGGFSREETAQIFGDYYMADVFDNHTATEAAAKIKAWEDAKRLRVGDVIKISAGSEGEVEGVVSKIKGSGCYVIFEDGSSGRFGKDDLIKTGRAIDIVRLLAKIGGQES